MGQNGNVKATIESASTMKHVFREGHAMPRLEGWGFLCLIASLVTIALSLTLLDGTWQAVGCGLGALLGILSGGLYAASVTPKSGAAAEPLGRTDSARRES
jgi:hypothetical protein